jgi:hypothetical protein
VESFAGCWQGDGDGGSLAAFAPQEPVRGPVPGTQKVEGSGITCSLVYAFESVDVVGNLVAMTFIHAELEVIMERLVTGRWFQVDGAGHAMAFAL